MTSEDVERAIDFLLKSQARLDARIELTNEQLARTDEQLRQLTKRLDSFADTQANIMRVMMQTFEAQARINESLRASDESLRASDESLRAAMTKLAARQEQTEESLAKLTQKVDLLVDAQAGTDRRLDALIKIVEEGRGGG